MKKLFLLIFFVFLISCAQKSEQVVTKIESKDLDEQIKIDIQQYISRIYGSLTTFNILFKNKEDHFKGVSKKE